MTSGTTVFPPDVGSVRQARLFVSAVLAEAGATAATDDAQTLISELATNAVLHARTPFTIQVMRYGDTVRIRVHDLSSVLPRQRSYGPESTTGRGLRLIASIASAWGVDAEPPGKAVWFELPADGARGDVVAWDEDLDVDALLAGYGDVDDAGDGPLAMAA